MSGMEVRTQLLDAFERTIESIVRTVGVSRLVAVDRAIRAIEFGVVGVTGAAVNVAIFLALVGKGAYLVPGLVSFWLAVAWTFGLNWLVTFDHVHGRFLRRFARYAAVCSLGYVLYTLVLAAAIEVGHLAYPIAVVAAVGIAGTWNFLGAERLAMTPAV